ncbi:hypothetical protein HYH03_006777 [Edaphochlamys debaryana]|uniref:Uncharacterized protein n=1 Tax=Edaphochlamys debaryana TaxID=47281 RepID=A0A835Y6P5_9CHLO|nr:hypothetical protein HYH03_006777 [Edaphochlamys debaryana]|eukprot:KAG2495171.1 hypothetical protein HYH03_006777 [Edaphochlamys debaryana]
MDAEEEPTDSSSESSEVDEDDIEFVVPAELANDAVAAGLLGPLGDWEGVDDDTDEDGHTDEEDGPGDEADPDAMSEEEGEGAEDEELGGEGEGDSGQEEGDEVDSEDGGGSSGEDSDDQYRRATTRKASRHAAAMEADMRAGVSLDLGIATQRGCLVYALPDQCGVHPCTTKAQHFQTMDCLALVPPPSAAAPPPQQQQKPQPRPARSGDAAASGDGASSSTAAAAAPRAASAGPTGAAAGGSAGTATTTAAAAAAAAAGVDEDGEIEVLIGGPMRLAVCSMPAPGRPGRLRQLCAVALQTNHYSIAVSPDGRFIAAGGDRGFLYIYAYVRERPAYRAAARAASASASASAGAYPSGSGSAAASPSPDGGGPDTDVPPGSPSPHDGAPRPDGSARLARLATFAFPVRGGFWGMNNMVRFGHFGGALRLLVAAQDKAIYLFHVPPWSGDEAELPRITAASFAITDLPRWEVTWSTPHALAHAQASVPDARARRHEAPAGPVPPGSAQGLGPQAGGVEGQGAGAAGAAAAAGSAMGAGGAVVAAAEEETLVQWWERACPNAGARAYWEERVLPTLQPQPDISPANRIPSFREIGDPVQLSLEAVPTTAAIVDFQEPLNAAEPSPDGRWLAVGSDAPIIHLVPAGPDYRFHPIEVLYVPLPPSLPGRLAPGCQYLKFNHTADKLAASFDALFSVFVFDVPRRQLVFSLRHHQWQPPLALAFVPGQPGLLAHATDRQHVTLVDVTRPSTTLTRISLKPPAQWELRDPRHDPADPGDGGGGEEGLSGPGPGPSGSGAGNAQGPGPGAARGEGPGGQGEGGGQEGQQPGHKGGPKGPPASSSSASRRARAARRAARRRLRPPHINGLVVTADGRLLVATNSELLGFRLLLPSRPWSRAVHPHLPPSFKSAVRTLLLTASFPAHRRLSPSSAADDGPGPATQPTATWAGSEAEAGAAGGSSGPSSSGAGSGSGSGPPAGPWSLPHDALEMVVAAASKPVLTWATVEAGEVLAFPVLDFWGQGRGARSAGADAQGGGGGSGEAGEGRARGLSPAVPGWDEPWDA